MRLRFGIALLLAVPSVAPVPVSAQDGELDLSFHLDGRASYPWPESFARARFRTGRRPVLVAPVPLTKGGARPIRILRVARFRGDR
jgi:hypothetical protein